MSTHVRTRPGLLVFTEPMATASHWWTGRPPDIKFVFQVNFLVIGGWRLLLTRLGCLPLPLESFFDLELPSVFDLHAWASDFPIRAFQPLELSMRLKRVFAQRRSEGWSRRITDGDRHDRLTMTYPVDVKSDSSKIKETKRKQISCVCDSSIFEQKTVTTMTITNELSEEHPPALNTQTNGVLHR
jgi:hypothetical protein